MYFRSINFFNLHTSLAHRLPFSHISSIIFSFLINLVKLWRINVARNALEIEGEKNSWQNDKQRIIYKMLYSKHRRCTGIFELAIKFLSNLSQNSLQSLKHVNFKIGFTLSSEYVVP